MVSPQPLIQNWARPAGALHPAPRIKPKRSGSRTALRCSFAALLIIRILRYVKLLYTVPCPHILSFFFVYDTSAYSQRDISFLSHPTLQTHWLAPTFHTGKSPCALRAPCSKFPFLDRTTPAIRRRRKEKRANPGDSLLLASRPIFRTQGCFHLIESRSY